MKGIEKHLAKCKWLFSLHFRIIKLICTGTNLRYIFILKKRFACTWFTEPSILNFWTIFAALKTIWLASNLLANQSAQGKIKRHVIALNFCNSPTLTEESQYKTYCNTNTTVRALICITKARTIFKLCYNFHSFFYRNLTIGWYFFNFQTWRAYFCALLKSGSSLTEKSALLASYQMLESKQEDL